MLNTKKTAWMLALVVGALVTATGCPDDDNNATPDPTPSKDMSMTPDMDPTPDMPTGTPDMPGMPDMETMPDMTTDLCANVDCAAKDPTCDGNNVVAYSEPTCDAGMCEYTETRTDCGTMGKTCAAGTCVDDTPQPDPTCQNYCDQIMANCTGDNAQYGSAQECMDYCQNVSGWEAGTKGDTSGDTIACRVYHGGGPAMADAALHCDHAGPSGGNVCGSWCDVYCNLSANNCQAGNSLYGTDAECQAACGGFSTDGEAGDVQYDTVQCRIYHAGAPAAADANTHCPHAGETPTDFCVGNADDFIFRTDAPETYTRYDRIGMPAVSTALISDKVGYNEQDPADDADANNPFVGEIVTNLTAVHTALDDDLTGEGLTPCSMVDTANNLPECVGQRVAQGGPIVASLVIPDTITVDPSQPAGFPNGRLLADPVIDVTLAIILLDMQAHTPTTLAELPLNPPTNDKGVEGAFLTTFPYLHPPHTP